MTVEKKEGAATWSVSAPLEKGSSDPIVPFQNKISNPIAAKFLNSIAEDGEITFQTFDDSKNKKDTSLSRIFHGTLEEHLQVLTDLNKKGAGIFFTVNRTNLKGRKREDIVQIRAVFVDLDGGPLEPVLAAPLKPHIIVQSSLGRFHAYWLVEGLALDDFTPIQKKLSMLFKGDQAVCDLPRVMRLPGFYHHKGDPVLVNIVEAACEVPYTRDQFLDAHKINFDLSQRENAPQLVIPNDPILLRLQERGLIIGESPTQPGKWLLKCPFCDQHTTGEDGAAYFEPHTNGYKSTGFHCFHDHCADKKIRDLKIFLSLEDVWNDPLPLKEELYSVAPFREEMLPEALRPWIMDISERMQVPSDFPAATCIVVLASLIGRKIAILPKAQDDWLVIPNLWGGIIGRPSSFKSPVVSEIMKPLDELAEKAIYKHRKDEELHKQNEKWAEARESAQKEEMKKAAKQSNVMPQLDRIEPLCEPILKRYKTEDGTVEKIGEILLENPQGILIHRDELMGFFKSLDKQGHEGNRAFFLESWNGNGQYTVDRIGRGTLHISALCLSIIGGIQPGPLQSYIHQATSGGGGDDGLLQRFQVIVWPDIAKTWENVDRSADLDAKTQAFEVFRNVDAFAPFEPSLDQEFKTFTLRFSQEAQPIFDAWRTSLEQKLRNGDLSPAMESHLAKYRSLMPSLALIFYVVETVGRGLPPIGVDVQSTLQAIAWCEYLETHAKRIYASGEDPSMASARALLEKIKKGELSDEFSPRDVYYSKHWSKLKTPEEVNSAIRILEEFGWIKVETIKTAGRPSMKVSVHPEVRRSQ